VDGNRLSPIALSVYTVLSGLAAHKAIINYNIAFLGVFRALQCVCRVGLVPGSCHTTGSPSIALFALGKVIAGNSK
jgi:hypothetical protein